MAKLVLAYEPVWAIGTGQDRDARAGQEAHAFIRGGRRAVRHSDRGGLVDPVRRSVKPDNAAGLLAATRRRRALVGGASLKADSFLGHRQGRRGELSLPAPPVADHTLSDVNRHAMALTADCRGLTRCMVACRTC